MGVAFVRPHHEFLPSDDMISEARSAGHRWHVVVILHGDPLIPHWMNELARRGALTVVINDPGDGRYRSLPTGAEILVNAATRGFAANVNAAFSHVRATVAPDILVCANFDLQLELTSIEQLIDVVSATPHVALAAPMLSDDKGRPVFSAGGLPTPLKEFTRAAGLRSGRLQRWQRILLRRTRGWQTRNATRTHRPLPNGEYLPWTLVAVSLDAWRDVGELDERFIMYAEDLDWGLRAQAAGWQAVLVQAGRVVHEERATRSALTTALYEASHLALHAKYGWDKPARWQRRGLAARRWWPFAASLDRNQGGLS